MKRRSDILFLLAILSMILIVGWTQQPISPPVTSSVTSYVTPLVTSLAPLQLPLRT
ncbi:MAG: hypothetical protein WCF90_04315 [Methanomicrobiales archaeon]